jgi:hypothetical protein
LPDQQWRIEHSPLRKALVVEAASYAVAEKAVEAWRKTNPAKALSSDPEKEAPIEFVLRDGTKVQRGVRWTFREID